MMLLPILVLTKRTTISSQITTWTSFVCFSSTIPTSLSYVIINNFSNNSLLKTYIRTCSLMFAIIWITTTAPIQVSVNFLHLYSFLCNHFNRSRLCSSNSSLNFYYCLSLYLVEEFILKFLLNFNDVKMDLTWLTASSAFLRNSAIFSSVCRRMSLIVDESWWWCEVPPSVPRCCKIEIARFVFSTMPEMHDNIVWILRHSSSPLPLPDDAVPLIWLPTPVPTRLLLREGASVLIDRNSSRLLCC